MTTDELSRTFSALGDPTRRAILARLAAGEATVGELAAPFDMTFAAVSKHLRVLQDAGLVSRGRDAQYRPARLDARPLAEASRWIGDYSQFWDDNLGAIDSYLSSLQQLNGSLPTSGPRDRRSPGRTTTDAPHDKENPDG
ncbi:metalloregulator ArsR/SmtB family transcription factor [Microbacterium sp.]|uniref:ArsR/SmtB family transcription factor n=1 Tax=Microbacterium sp. TaxID=51671 RepID=UPI002E2F714E|nr:metalloregulator ArsR/SmtB family transcription factor [Microbacterium sp.]HEX5728322.1 metalloregulator ArsR/SmtB family transcription factor [Microbacterium sp.]